MTAELITALAAAVSTFVGSLAGILVSNRLTVYRIEQLEKKLDKFTDAQVVYNDDIKEQLNKLEEKIYSLDESSKEYQEYIRDTNNV